MTVPSQLSLGTKQKAHQERDREEEEAETGGRGRGVGLVLLVTPVPSRGLFLMKCRPPEHSRGEVSTSAAARLQMGGGGRFRWSLAGETFNSDRGRVSVHFDRIVLSSPRTPLPFSFSSILLISSGLKNSSEWPQRLSSKAAASQTLRLSGQTGISKKQRKVPCLCWRTKTC